jgi:transposase
MGHLGGLLSGPGTPARGRCPEKGGATLAIEPVDGEALGRSRGGLTSKIHLAVDGRGRPLSILITPGQAGDNPQIAPLLEAITIRGRRGRPRRRPERVIADKAYDHPSTRAMLCRRGIAATIPLKTRPKRCRPRRGRPPAFDPDIYTRRNVVERCFNRLKQWRDLATRYAKRAAIYRASLTIAAIIIWLT